MRKSIFDKRIPTLFALLLLIIGIGVISFLTSKTVTITGFASPDEKPQNVRISNMNDTSFTISYVSAKPVLGTISYGTTEDALKQIAFDDRDQQGSTNSYNTHHISVKGLSPQTTYYFKITSGSSTFLNDGKAYQATTAPALPSNSEQAFTITGSTNPLDINSSSGALVYVTTNDGQTLSTLTNTQGSFTISTKGMRDTSFGKYLTLTSEQKMDLIILNQEASSRVFFALKNGNPIPPITLGQNYDFTLDNSSLPSQEASTSAEKTFPFFAGEATETNQITITTPKKNEGLTDQKPNFEGNAVPNQEINILIESDTEIRANVSANNKGAWSYRPDQPLAPGNHTITVTTRDVNGLLRTISRQFVVYAEGSQFTEPSISPVKPTIKPTITLTSTPIPTLSEPTPTTMPTTPTPLETISPTEILTPTIMPSIIDTPPVTPRPTVAPTGSTSLSMLSLLSVVITISGIILLLLTRGGSVL